MMLVVTLNIDATTRNGSAGFGREKSCDDLLS